MKPWLSYYYKYPSYCYLSKTIRFIRQLKIKKQLQTLIFSISELKPWMNRKEMINSWQINFPPNFNWEVIIFNLASYSKRPLPGMASKNFPDSYFEEDLPRQALWDVTLV